MSGNRGPSRSSFGADERVVAQQVDVIADQHQVARRPLRVHPAAGVRHDQRPRAERVQHAHRKGDLLELVAFVAMEPALHRHHRAPAEPAEQQLPGMGLHRGQREARDVAVRDLGVSTAISRASPPRPVPRMIPTSGATALRPRTDSAAACTRSNSDVATVMRGLRTTPSPAEPSSRLPPLPRDSRPTCPSRAPAADVPDAPRRRGGREGGGMPGAARPRRP